jgi:two-component system, OmpR family, sensor kinase
VSSLFARIWLSYWLAMAVAVVAALLVTLGLAVERIQTLDRLNPAVLALSAQDALARNGNAGLRAWQIERIHALPELHIYFVDPRGRELFDRPVTGQPLRGAPEGTKISGSGTFYRMYIRRTSRLVFDFWSLALQPLILVALAIGASGLGSAWLSHHLTRPIVQLRTGVREFAGGNLDARIGPPLAARKDELGSLASDFDAMAQNLRDHIRSKEELLRDVSHELRSPLARLRIAAGLAKRGSKIGEPQAFDQIDKEVEKLDALIGQILRFSRVESRPPIGVQTVDIHELAEEIAADAQLEAAACRKSVLLRAASPLMVTGDRELLRSAIENVVRNAVRHTAPGSTVEFAARNEANGIAIEVTDSGPGVDNAALMRIFEPFYRDGTTDGAGLGLAIARKIVDLHHGTIAAENRPAGGLSVRICLPHKSPANEEIQNV